MQGRTRGDLGSAKQTAACRAHAGRALFVMASALPRPRRRPCAKRRAALRQSESRPIWSACACASWPSRLPSCLRTRSQLRHASVQVAECLNAGRFLALDRPLSLLQMADSTAHSRSSQKGKSSPLHQPSHLPAVRPLRSMPQLISS